MATEPRPTTATATTNAASPTVPLMAQPRIDVVFIVPSFLLLSTSVYRFHFGFWIVGSSNYFIRSRQIGHEVVRRIIIGNGERRGPGLGGAPSLGGERCRKEGLEDALRAGGLCDDPVADAIDPHVGRLRERAGGVASPLRAGLRVEGARDHQRRDVAVHSSSLGLGSLGHVPDPTQLRLERQLGRIAQDRGREARELLPTRTQDGGGRPIRLPLAAGEALCH